MRFGKKRETRCRSARRIFAVISPARVSYLKASVHRNCRTARVRSSRFQVAGRKRSLEVSSFYNQPNEISSFFVDLRWAKPYSNSAMKKFTLTLALFCACGALAYAGPEPLASKEIAPAPMPTSCFEGWYFGIHGGALLSNF